MSKVGSVHKDIVSLTGKRGAKQKWGPFFAQADEIEGWVCVAEAEDAEDARKIYNNVRSAAHRAENSYTVAIGEDFCVYVKSR